MHHLPPDLLPHPFVTTLNLHLPTHPRTPHHRPTPIHPSHNITPIHPHLVLPVRLRQQTRNKRRNLPRLRPFFLPQQPYQSIIIAATTSLQPRLSSLPLLFFLPTTLTFLALLLTWLLPTFGKPLPGAACQLRQHHGCDGFDLELAKPRYHVHMDVVSTDLGLDSVKHLFWWGGVSYPYGVCYDERAAWAGGVGSVAER